MAGVCQFSEETQEEIKLNYPNLTNKQICEKFGCGNSWLEAFTTKHKLRKNKIDRDDEFKDAVIVKLKIIKRLDRKEKNNWIWLCQCECGKTKHIRSSLLRNKKVSDCGCETRKRIGISHHNRKGFGDMSGKQWARILSHAVERG